MKNQQNEEAGMIVLIDNGHGENTPGKCSPDKRLREYAYAREIAKRVADELAKKHIPSVCIVPEEEDILLKERCERANQLTRKNTGVQTCLVSIHCNAIGMGQWQEPGKIARGWSVYVSLNASANSKQLATCLYEAAKKEKVRIHGDAPQRPQPYKVQNLAICRDTCCPAVLIENFFQDNRDDVEFLLSEAGKKCVTDICVNGLLQYIDQKKPEKQNQE